MPHLTKKQEHSKHSTAFQSICIYWRGTDTACCVYDVYDVYNAYKDIPDVTNFDSDK